MSTTETTWYSPSAERGARPPSRRWMLGLMACIFLSGTVIGGGSTMIVVNHRMEEAAGRHLDAACSRMVPALQKELDLSEVQTAEVAATVRRHLTKLDEIRETLIRPAMASEFKQMEDQVAAVLDADQKERWHSWLEERRKRCRLPGAAHHRRKAANSADARRAGAGDSAKASDGPQATTAETR
jgi:hypothetical protein